MDLVFKGQTTTYFRMQIDWNLGDGKTEFRELVCGVGGTVDKKMNFDGHRFIGSACGHKP